MKEKIKIENFESTPRSCGNVPIVHWMDRDCQQCLSGQVLRRKLGKVFGFRIDLAWLGLAWLESEGERVVSV